jgi:hypothetical protein
MMWDSSLMSRLSRRSPTNRLRHDVGWELANPTEARKPLEPAKTWKPDEPAEAPRFHCWQHPDPTSQPKIKNTKSLMLQIVVSAFLRKDTGDKKQVQGVNI